MDVKTIALDVMSGDKGIAIAVPAALEAIKRDKSLNLILVGDESQIISALNGFNSERIQIQHTTQVVAMDESPMSALRTKKDSSMRVAINCVKDGRAHACVSAGNTGALMATARFVLKTLPGIDRPAIISSLPTKAQPIWFLDLGANVDSTAEHLLQFAVMGSAMITSITGKPSPRVALLNIGSEEIKGNETVKLAKQKLAECKDINFVGFIEGDSAFNGTVDIVVCDGFVGNVALKTIEGVAQTLTHYIKQSFQSTYYGKFIACLAYPIIRKLGKKLDPSRYNGASLLGLNGIVIKSHGGTDVLGLRHAIEEACKEVESDVPCKISDKITMMLQGVEKK